MSPCVLPLIPAYISFIAGASLEELKENRGRAAVMARAALFVLGFGLVFTLLGTAAGAAGGLFTHMRWIRIAGGVVVILFGLHIAGLNPIKFLYFEKRMQFKPTRVGGLAAFLIGVAFAVGWSPCVGPILAGILTLAANEASAARGTALLAVYSIGMGIPFLLAALAMDSFLRFFTRIRKYFRAIEIASGALLVLIGILLITDKFEIINRFFNAL